MTLPDGLFDPLAALGDEQRTQLGAYAEHLLGFNRRLNLVSRETSLNEIQRHIRHCLALTRRAFPPASVVVDWGTGGGLPAIPLAIAFPNVTFHAVDAVGKKIAAVNAMARRLGLENLMAWHGRAERWDGRAHYSVSRATAPLADLWQWHRIPFDPDTPPHDETHWQPGLICLKGGDLSAETVALHAVEADLVVQTAPLDALFGAGFFEEKYIVAVRKHEAE